ncbi:glycosyltransferase family 4 protein [uncultured Marixanthomonas sp.]|uniref:glycosyltransferase family 4 protein n=1 Tax=uncultured Marixanthomonas sp. TaxID=757245 RepID=UPI0030D6FFA8|tara:strand:- start:38735 stop:39787 length:1053 start_codon:yes stop_codon:yes gene_type:complete
MDKRIKVLYTIPNFKTAGSQYVLLSLFNRLDKTKFDPYVCVESYPELIPEEIPIDRRLTFQFSNHLKQDIRRFRKKLKAHAIDMVHSWDYKSNYREPLACRFAGVKYLYTKKNNAWSKRWMLKSILSNHIIYNNPEMKKRFFSSLLFHNKTSFIPHGIDTTVFKPFPSKSRDTFNLGCIGNINSNKNQLFLIKIIKSLPKNVVLHLYGNEEKEYRHMLNKYIQEYELESRVQFHGFIENNKISKILNTLDLFVLPSINEGLPVSILEAMASGVPVLSSDSGGGSRHLLDSKYIFSLKNPEELIEKILKIYQLENVKKNMIINQGIQTIHRNYTLINEVNSYENIYKTIID